MEKSKKKQLIVSIIAIVLLIVATVGVTYAFFNYTRTGTANTISVGRIVFNSQQTNTISLTNVFPIDSDDVATDTDNVGTATITITGDTMYSEGVEYLLSATNVTNAVGTGNNQKTIPISISATASGTLGTSDDDYFDDRDSATSHIYKVLAGDTISNNDQLMVGYIAQNATGINGTITIKAYLDKDKIAISDTYDGTAGDNMGTTSNWVNERTILTTTEWNSLNSAGLSFQVKVEANEGIWVVDRDRNDMKAFTSEITNVKSSITEINFIKAAEEEINTHSNLIDLTADVGNGIVKAWIENNKLYIASPGTTYFPESCAGLLSDFTNVTTILFNNVNTSNVIDMQGMFSGNHNLSNIDLSSFNTRHVTAMNGMFQNDTSLTNLDLTGLGSSVLSNSQNMFSGCSNMIAINMSNFNFGLSTYNTFLGASGLITLTLTGSNTSNVSTMQGMFNGCSNLTNIIGLSSFNTNRVTSFTNMFSGCSSLINLDLSSFNTSACDGTSGNAYNMFNGCTNLTTIYVSNLWDMTSQPSSMPIFNGCTSLKGGGTPQTTYNASYIDKTYARIDGGLNSQTPGYLTLKTN